MKLTPAQERELSAAKAAVELAACYTRLFKSEDGWRVLKDLLAKYPPDRPRFYDGKNIDPDPVRASFRDGQSSVTWEIRQAIETGKMSPNEPNQPN